MSYYTDVQYRVNEQDDSTEKNVRFYTYFRDIEGEILDVGCSLGNFLALDPERIQGIDIDTSAIEICTERGLRARQMSLIEKLDFPDDTFSAIHGNEVIEHIAEPLGMLKELRRVLKPGGKLVMFTPDWLKSHGTTFYDDYTHVRPFTKHSLEVIAYDAGFRDFKVEYDYRPVKGLGWLVRNTGIGPKEALKFQKILKSIGFKHQQLVLTAWK
jgi:2-polyprenyl-3-methyl-5-hydroxy-6-metoxy-1,4-benzoquinol methylase